MTRWGVPKGVMRVLPKRGKSGNSDGGGERTIMQNCMRHLHRTRGLVFEKERHSRFSQQQ